MAEDDEGGGRSKQPKARRGGLANARLGWLQAAEYARGGAWGKGNRSGARHQWGVGPGAARGD